MRVIWGIGWENVVGLGVLIESDPLLPDLLCETFACHADIRVRSRWAREGHDG